MIVLLLFVIAWLDYATGTAPVQHLYYLPIILAAFIFDYWGGLASASRQSFLTIWRINICVR